MKIQESTLKKIIGSISMTRDVELDCGECRNEVDQYVDMLRDGHDPASVKPLVKSHMDMCGNCKEELEALLVALDALEGV